MRSLVFMMLVGFSVFLVLAQAFRNNFEHKLEQDIRVAVSSTTLSSAPSEPEKQPEPTPAFRGPIGKPYIIGPTANPPNR